MKGVWRILSLSVGGSSTNASFGTVSGVTLEVTQNGTVPWRFVASQPAGSAGATTLSKFSESPQTLPARAVGAVAIAVATAITVRRLRIISIRVVGTVRRLLK